VPTDGVKKAFMGHLMEVLEVESKRGGEQTVREQVEMVQRLDLAPEEALKLPGDAGTTLGDHLLLILAGSLEFEGASALAAAGPSGEGSFVGGSSLLPGGFGVEHVEKHGHGKKGSKGHHHQGGGLLTSHPTHFLCEMDLEAKGRAGDKGATLWVLTPPSLKALEEFNNGTLLNRMHVVHQLLSPSSSSSSSSLPSSSSSAPAAPAEPVCPSTALLTRCDIMWMMHRMQRVSFAKGTTISKKGVHSMYVHWIEGGQALRSAVADNLKDALEEGLVCRLYARGQCFNPRGIISKMGKEERVVNSGFVISGPAARCMCIRIKSDDFVTLFKTGRVVMPE
jgi:hypothetical protein